MADSLVGCYGGGNIWLNGYGDIVGRWAITALATCYRVGGGGIWRYGDRTCGAAVAPTV